MAAFLRLKLILDMYSCGPRILETADHMHDVERFAVAGIAVDKHRQAAGPRDLTNKERNLIDGDDAQIGQPH
jgi:hypothetical protein